MGRWIAVLLLVVACASCSSSKSHDTASPRSTSSSCGPLLKQESALHSALVKGGSDIAATNDVVAQEDAVFDRLVAAGCTPAWVRPIALIPHVTIPQ